MSKNKTIDALFNEVRQATLDHDHMATLVLKAEGKIKHAVTRIAQDLAGYVGNHKVIKPDRSTTFPHAYLKQGDETNFVINSSYEPGEKTVDCLIHIRQATRYGSKKLLQNYLARLGLEAEKKDYFMEEALDTA